MLKTTEISIPFTKGVNTKTDEKISGEPLAIINSFIEKDGVLRKKFGCRSISINILDGGTLSAAIDIFEFENDLIMSTESGFYSYIVELDKWKHISFSTLSTVTNSEVSPSQGFGSAAPDYDSGYVENETNYIVSKVSDTGVTVELRARESGILLARRGMITAKLVRNGNQIGIIGVEATPASPNDLVWIKADVSDFSTPLFIDEVIAKGESVSSSNNAPISTFSVADGVYIVFEKLFIQNQFIVKLNAVGAIAHQVQSSYVASPLGITTDFTYSSIVAKTNSVDIFTSNAEGTEIRRENRSLDLLTLNRTDIIETGLSVSAHPIYSATELDGITYLWGSLLPSFLFIYEVKEVAPYVSQKRLVGSNYTIFRLNSFAFTCDNRVMATVKIYSGLTTELTEAVYIIDKDFNIISTLSEINVKTQPFPKQTLEPVYCSPDGIKKTFIDNGVVVTLSNTELNKSVGKSIEFQRTKIIPSGFNYIYDGDNVFNLGFSHTPDIFCGISGGGNLTGDFEYKAVYKIIDSRGNIYRSGTSPTFPITLTADTASITVSPFLIPNSPVGVDDVYGFIEIYRKEAQEGNYRLVATSQVSSTTTNDTVFFDNDTNISANEFLYTTGDDISELENATPPSFKDITWHNGRAFAVSARTNEIVYSKIYSGGFGIAFPSESVIRVEDNQGRRSEKTNSIASLDSKLIIFKANTILAIFGEGPDNAGLSSDFTEPELITTDVGCISPKSVVLTGDGIMFQSSKGFYTLARSMQANYTGTGIEKFQSDSVVFSLLLEDRNQVRFITSEGRSLVYNTFYKEWTWHDDLVGVIGGANYKGDFSYVDGTGLCLIEDETIFRKNGAKIERFYDTGWLKLVNIQNFQRVKRLILEGEYYDEHQLEVIVSYDYDDSTEDSYILTPLVGERYQNSVHLRRQKSQSIRVQIKEIDTGLTQEGFKLTDLTIIAGVRKGINKLPKERQY